jgi:hypothetical protein
MKNSILLTLAAASCLLSANTAADVIPPGANPHGKSYAEWSATWWQWALSLPASENPLFDEGVSVNGANGQSGKVWFLTGVFNASGIANRSLTVPAGTMLFFPVINTECSTLEGAPFHGENATELTDCATSFTVGNLVADIDGVPVSNLEQFEVTSSMFAFTVPEENVLGVAAGTGFAVSNGVYLMLSPLSVGEHVVHFGGTFLNFDFTLDITYHITVAPK